MEQQMDREDLPPGETWDNMTFWKAGYDAGYNSALRHDTLNDLIGSVNTAAAVIVVVNLFALIVVLALA